MRTNVEPDISELDHETHQEEVGGGVFGVLEGVVCLKDARQEHRCKVVALDTITTPVVHDLIDFQVFVSKITFLLFCSFVELKGERMRNKLSGGGKGVVRGLFCWELEGITRHLEPSQVR